MKKMPCSNKAATVLLAGLFAVLLVPGLASAQQFTGKISGTVVEAGTSVPLPGVNVVVEGTLLGAATDLQGRFDILRVPPGSHTLIVSFVGYQTQRVQDVRVTVDRTTTLNLELEEESVVGEEVTITAERPIVVRDQTGTATSFSIQEIEAAPVEGLRGLLELTAGVERTPQGNFSVRGGGSYEVSFMVDGVQQIMSSSAIPGTPLAGEKANNSWKYDVNPFGVEEMEVITGGFSAEYGNAQSGVVKVVTREGTRNFEGAYRMEYRGPGQYHWGPYLYGLGTVEWDRWGDRAFWEQRFPDSSAAWIARMHNMWMMYHSPGHTVEVDITDRQGRVIYPAGTYVENKLGVYDYRQLSYTRHLFGVGGPLGVDPDRLRFYVSGEFRNKPTRIPTSEQIQEYRNITATVTFQPTRSHKFRFSNTYQYYLGSLVSGSDDIRWAGRDGAWKYTLSTDPTRTEVTLTHNVGWTYAIDARSYLETTLAYSYEQYRVPIYPVTQPTDPWMIPTGVWDEDYRRVFSTTTFYQQDTRTHYLDLTFQYTNQITRTWQLKTGIQGKRWDMVNSSVSSQNVNAFIARTGFADFNHTRPVNVAAYLQNRLEFEGMVANLGLRLEGYNFGADVPQDRFNPFYPALAAESVGDPRMESSRTHVRLSPRFGLSFPIGEWTAFRIQYGHFSSMPQFRQAFARSTNLGWGAYGNPNLRPERTISFEFGLQQALSPNLKLDVVGYYNDRKDQIGLLRFAAPSASTRQSKQYVSYENNAYGSTVGMELALERILRRRFGYRLSYTLSRTTFGSHGPVILFSDDPDDPRNFQTRQSAAEFLAGGDRPHRIRGFLNYRIPARSGPQLFGTYPFESTVFGLIYTAQSGTPYTYNLGFDETDVINNRRYPLEEQFDLHASKDVAFGGVDLQLGLRVSNLFNHRWLTPMLEVRPSPTEPIRPSTELQRWVHRGVTTEDPHRYKLDYFRTYRNIPREVFFSVGLKF